MKDVSHEIHKKFHELGADIPLEEIEDRLNKMVSKFKVPKEEARRSVVNFFLKEHNIPRNQYYTGQSESPLMKISEMNTDGKWVSVKAKVVQLWENNHSSISQVGIIADETGTMKFTKWTSAELADIVEDQCYLFKNVVVNEWNGKFQINMNKTSVIEELEEDIVAGTSSVTFTGALVDIQSGSGLIKRCPQCNRALTKGACMEHGKVDGTYDLRIKAVLDNGITAQDTLIKRELAEVLTGLTLDNAISLAAEALDQTVVFEEMKRLLVGKYYTATGSKIDRYLLVDSMTGETTMDANELDTLLAIAEVL